MILQYLRSLIKPSTLKLRFYPINAWAILPKKAHSDKFADAAFDLHYSGVCSIQLLPGEQALINTGLAVLIPSGYWLKFHERSGLAAKHGIKVSAGVIDSGYTNELRVVLLNTSKNTITIDPKQAITQFTVEKVLPVTVEWVDKTTFEFESSLRKRGLAGFGSSDKK